MTTSAMVPLAFLAGATLGAAYFASLRATVSAVTGGRRGPWLLPLGFAGRLALAAWVFGTVLGWGILPLTAALIGFICARTVAVRSACAVADGSDAEEVAPWS